MLSKDKLRETNNSMVENLEEAEELGEQMEKMKTPAQVKAEGRKPDPEQ